jgi:hypothetical protein
MKSEIVFFSAANSQSNTEHSDTPSPRGAPITVPKVPQLENKHLKFTEPIVRPCVKWREVVISDKIGIVLSSQARHADKMIQRWNLPVTGYLLFLFVVYSSSASQAPVSEMKGGAMQSVATQCDSAYCSHSSETIQTRIPDRPVSAFLTVDQEGLFFEQNYKKESVEYSSPISKKERARNVLNDSIDTYNHLLTNHAVITKSLTSGGIGLMGDVLAQFFEFKQLQRSSKAFTLDRKRAIGLFIEGSFISGPLMHYAFDLMEDLVPVHANDEIDSNEAQNSHLGKQWGAAIFHVVADIVIMGPMYVLSLMVTTSFIEGRLSTLREELLRDFGSTYWASFLSSLAFGPAQVVAFGMLPVQYRLLYINIQDVVWNAVVSYMVHRSRE